MSDKNLHKLKELIETQCSEGNYDYDPYMHGMANGMICAESVITETEPQYMAAPEKWLAGKSYTAADLQRENLAILDKVRDRILTYGTGAIIHYLDNVKRSIQAECQRDDQQSEVE